MKKITFRNEIEKLKAEKAKALAAADEAKSACEESRNKEVYVTTFTHFLL